MIFVLAGMSVGKKPLSDTRSNTEYSDLGTNTNSSELMMMMRV